MPEGNKAVAILLLLALMFGGFVITFNLLPVMTGFSLGLEFSNINGIISGFWIILVRMVGIALIGLTGYVIVNIIKN